MLCPTDLINIFLLNLHVLINPPPFFPYIFSFFFLSFISFSFLSSPSFPSFLQFILPSSIPVSFFQHFSVINMSPTNPYFNICVENSLPDFQLFKKFLIQKNNTNMCNSTNMCNYQLNHSEVSISHGIIELMIVSLTKNSIEL